MLLWFSEFVRHEVSYGDVDHADSGKIVSVVRLMRIFNRIGDESKILFDMNM